MLDRPLLGSLPDFTQQQAQDINSLWLYNEGDGDKLTDSFPNQNHGTINGSSWFWDINESGLVLDFNGGDYVAVANEPNFDRDSDKQFSIINKLKVDGAASAGSIFGKMNTGLPFEGIQLFYNHASLFRFQLTSASNNEIFLDYSQTSLSDDLFNLVSATYNGSLDVSGCFVYKNEIEVPFRTETRNNLTGSILTNAGFAIGARNATGVVTFNGVYEASRVYNTNISLDKISEIIRDPHVIFDEGFNFSFFGIPAGAIMNQFQGPNLGADLFNGTLM